MATAPTLVLQGLTYSKCDAVRPICRACTSLDAICEYDTLPGESKQVAARRERQEMREELTEFREIFHYLRTKSQKEVSEVLRLIKSDAEPSTILRLLKEGDIHIDASLLGAQNPHASAMAQIEEHALQSAAFKVPARPWTTVAKDGIVSELISSFFTPENRLICTFVDLEWFLEDMRSQAIGDALLCSPFLVNIMCAIAAVNKNLLI